jgi:hypothetical protein
VRRSYSSQARGNHPREGKIVTAESHWYEAEELLRWASGSWIAITKGTIHDGSTASLLREIEVATRLAQAHMYAIHTEYVVVMQQQAPEQSGDYATEAQYFPNE